MAAVRSSKGRPEPGVVQSAHSLSRRAERVLNIAVPCTLHSLTSVHGYPQLPAISLQTRSPYGWWDPQERKNFDEVVSVINGGHGR